MSEKSSQLAWTEYQTDHIRSETERYFDRYWSIQPVGEVDLHSIKRLIVIGGSGGGKSTLISRLKGSGIETSGVFIPQRVVTSPDRGDDVGGENVHVSDDEFARLQEYGSIEFPWSKQLPLETNGAIKPVRYGFMRGGWDGYVPALTLYAANNGLYANPDSWRQIEGANTLIACVTAPQEVRAVRLYERLPTMGPAEARIRTTDNLQLGMKPHVNVSTYGLHQGIAAAEFAEFVTDLTTAFQ
ncbi:MAG: hypothetical protein A3I39_02065 [Candidatus Yanofskybacteria bacterium RIFCSPLOWO2_02_FULL_47_9b]|uniref:Uncharacterized protein n=1 Tax=Candidatus Yanofskybacteria bacterium RIFCSPLOWO2_02_FULL_47_9b TaxID=1802708 RepID=A0A1F8H9U3_9BACT|nr:MAG: hypothetical protein A3I39_02065 [Candidatus Yanofskybacteria bacterium RIFCSPLOWO2_02_FULL_47_9b]